MADELSLRNAYRRGEVAPGDGRHVLVAAMPKSGSSLLIRRPVLSAPPCWAAMSLTIVLAFSVRVSTMLSLRRCWHDPSTLPGLRAVRKPAALSGCRESAQPSGPRERGHLSTFHLT